MVSQKEGQPGAPVFFFENVLYYFGNSTSFPGSVALFRRIEGRTAEELVAPFDPGARFKFFVRNVDTSTVTPPAVLDSLVGVVPVPSSIRSKPFSGTSAASPQAAGLAALWLSKHPKGTANQVRAALQSAAIDVAAIGHDVESGYGMMQLPTLSGLMPAQ